MYKCKYFTLLEEIVPDLNYYIPDIIGFIIQILSRVIFKNVKIEKEIVQLHIDNDFWTIFIASLTQRHDFLSASGPNAMGN